MIPPILLRFFVKLSKRTQKSMQHIAERKFFNTMLGGQGILVKLFIFA